MEMDRYLSANAMAGKGREPTHSNPKMAGNAERRAGPANRAWQARARRVVDFKVSQL